MASLGTTLLLVFELTSVLSVNFLVAHSKLRRGGDISLRQPFSPLIEPPNLIFIKIPKAASSTTGGVARRIADRHGLGCVSESRCDWKTEPSVSAHHRERKYLESLPLKKPIAWITSIRDPLSRCLSMFYHFEVGINGVADTDENKLEFMKSEDCINFQWNYLCPASICRRNDTKAALESYNSIVLAERYDESLTLLIRALGLSLSDALYLNAKESSSFPVPHRELDDEPATVQAFGRSMEFRAQNKLDYEMWNMVNDHIDAEMTAHENQKLYGAFSQLLQRATLECHTSCTWDVTMNAGLNCEDCYWHDNGCGYACFDSLPLTP